MSESSRCALRCLLVLGFTLSSLLLVDTGFGVSYAVPLITDRDYNFGQVQNSYIFLARTCAGLVSNYCIGVASKRPWGSDRRIMLVLTCLGEAAYVVYCLLSGFGGSKISIVVFVAILTTAAFGNSAPALQGV